MKIIITIILTFAALVGWGQTDSMFTGAGSGTALMFVGGGQPYTLKWDTSKVWFKEVSFQSDGGHLELIRDTIAIRIDSIPVERWTKGYIVKPIIDGMYESWGQEYPQTEYLYFDRKTKVTNMVIYSIERK